MDTSRDSMQHWLVVLLLGVVGLLIIMVFVSLRTQGDTTNDQTTTTTISNVAPTITNLSLNYLTAAGSTVDDSNDFITGDGQSKRLYATFDVTDPNGCQEVWTDSLNGANGGLYLGVGQQDVISTSSADFDTPCNNGASSAYEAGSCNIDAWTSAGGSSGQWTCSATEACSGSLDNSMTVECYVDIPYYADADEWVMGVFAQDAAGTLGGASQDFTIPELNALSLSSASIPYGSLALGATSTEISIQIDNTGNETLQPRIEQTDFICSTGGIVASATHMATTAGLAYASMPQPLANAVADISGFTIDDADFAAADYGSNSTYQDSIYLMLQVPTTGARGTCTATTTFTASSGA